MDSMQARHANGTETSGPAIRRRSIRRGLVGALVSAVVAATVIAAPAVGGEAALGTADDAAPIPLRLEATVVREGVALRWSPCEVEPFRGYAVVRSKDERVTWPLGDGDAVIAKIEGQDATRFLDTDAPAGRRAWYRVFGFGGDARQPACASVIAGVAVPDALPVIRLAVGLRNGVPALRWSSCDEYRFDGYAIVRSKDERATWPLGDGDSLAGTASPDARHAFLDEDAPAGATIHYRVFCLRRTDDGAVVVAASPVRRIATPALEPDAAAALR
jgi:hypothetical protein